MYYLSSLRIYLSIYTLNYDYSEGYAAVVEILMKIFLMNALSWW